MAARKPDGREAWVGLESNPEVMTKYAHSLGVAEGWGFSDCWGLDDEALAMVPTPCVACIFLYPYSQMEARKRALGAARGEAQKDVWFMQQHVSNACGAVAIMHAAMNNLDRIGEGSSFLSGFRDKCAGASAAERAELFARAIREIHEAHAAGGQTDAPTPTAELDFHFVTYVEVHGRVYELDGNNDGPLDCGAVGTEGLLKAMVRYVRAQYMAAFPDAHYSIITLGPRVPP